MAWPRSRLLSPSVLTLLSFLLPAGANAQTAVVPLFSAQKSVATGTAISGKSTNGLGVYGYTEDGIAVQGRDAGTLEARGYGGYFTSNTGVGVFGKSTASSTAFNNIWAPGVYGYSVNGCGVLGVSDAEDWHGAGVRGESNNYYAGVFKSKHYRGILATSGNNYYAAYFDSGTDLGAGIYVRGNITATGSKSGYVVDVAINDGNDTLEAGDVVVVTGAADPLLGRIPLIRVRKSTVAASTAIVGVVDRLFTPPASGEPGQGPNGEAVPPAPDSVADPGGDTTAIAPGQYLSIVTLGAFRVIKADATPGPIRPGSLLVSSDEPGYAMAAAAPATGTVIGKALAGLESGTGLIPVMVTMH